MWTIIIFAFAMVNGQLEIIARYETESEFSSRLLCEEILNSPTTDIVIPDLPANTVDVQGFCTPIGDLSSYM